jgi:hypothetical protein
VLSLLVDVALTAGRVSPSLARIAVDWLRGVCDDVPENNNVVLRAGGFPGGGLMPFLVLLDPFLWAPAPVPAVVAAAAAAAAAGAPGGVLTSSLTAAGDAPAPAAPAAAPADIARLQVSEPYLSPLALPPSP